MKLKDALDNYYYFSGKVSDIARQLAFAGIALIWIFRIDAKGAQLIPSQLYVATKWLVITLILDFAHYLSATLAWGMYHRVKEKRTSVEKEFLAPRYINWPAIFFFWLKVVALIWSYTQILTFLNRSIHALP